MTINIFIDLLHEFLCRSLFVWGENLIFYNNNFTRKGLQLIHIPVVQALVSCWFLFTLHARYVQHYQKILLDKEIFSLFKANRLWNDLTDIFYPILLFLLLFEQMNVYYCVDLRR